MRSATADCSKFALKSAGFSPAERLTGLFDSGVPDASAVRSQASLMSTPKGRRRVLGVLEQGRGSLSVSTPRRRGILTAIRALLIARRSAVTERTRVLNQLHALNATAPIQLRDRIGNGTGKQLQRRILSMLARPSTDIEERVAFAVMRDLATHSRTLAADAKRYERELADLSARSTTRCSTSPASAQSPPQSCSPATPPLQARSRLRALQRHRTDPRLLRQDDPPPPQPRRRPPSQQRHPHHRDHPRQAPTPRPAPTSTAASEKARPGAKPSAPSSATSPASSTTASSPSP